MFKYNCFVEFSLENKWIFNMLDDIGYRPCFKRIYVDRYLVCEKDIQGNPAFHFMHVPPQDDDYIDCGDNIWLFSEVVTISDDTDYMNMFIVDNGFVLKNGVFFLSGERCRCVKDKCGEEYLEQAHKATLEEIMQFYE